MWRRHNSNLTKQTEPLLEKDLWQQKIKKPDLLLTIVWPHLPMEISLYIKPQNADTEQRHHYFSIAENNNNREFAELVLLGTIMCY